MSYLMLKPAQKTTSSNVRFAPRLDSLEGRVIGTLWNNRPHGDKILRQLGEELQQRYGVAEMVHRKKLYINTRAPVEILEELKAKCAAVVVGVGD